MFGDAVELRELQCLHRCAAQVYRNGVHHQRGAVGAGDGEHGSADPNGIQRDWLEGIAGPAQERCGRWEKDQGRSSTRGEREEDGPIGNIHAEDGFALPFQHVKAGAGLQETGRSRESG